MMPVRLRLSLEERTLEAALIAFRDSWRRFLGDPDAELPWDVAIQAETSDVTTESDMAGKTVVTDTMYRFDTTIQHSVDISKVV